MNRIFCIMGKSSSGKDSVYRSVIMRPDIEPLVIYTTRPMRENELDGREYHFVDRQVFDTMTAQGKVIESRIYNTVHGEWIYFTSAENIDLSKHSYAVIGTLESYLPIKKYFGADTVVPVYLEVEDGLRLIRAIERERQEENPKYAELCRRFLADSEDFSEEKLAQAGIVRRFSNNSSYEECLAEVMDFISEHY